MVFEKMMMEEALAQLMQGSEAAELILPQPAVLVSASQARRCVFDNRVTPVTRQRARALADFAQHQ